MALYFDKKGLAEEILSKLENELKDACKAWELDAYKYFRGIKYTYSRKNLKAEVETQVEKNNQTVIAYFRANTIALADSYGTGSLMLEDNPGLKEYKANKGDEQGQWNPNRTGKAITGRREGTYTDIFGQVHTTSGVFKGKKIENRRDVTDTNYYISPTNPSRAIQIADKWFYQTYLPNAYKLAIKEINFAKYLKEK